jgi:hypothetical protein
VSLGRLGKRRSAALEGCRIDEAVSKPTAGDDHEHHCDRGINGKRADAA